MEQPRSAANTRGSADAHTNTAQAWQHRTMLTTSTVCFTVNVFRSVTAKTSPTNSLTLSCVHLKSLQYKDIKIHPFTGISSNCVFLIKLLASKGYSLLLFFFFFLTMITLVKTHSTIIINEKKNPAEVRC